MSPSSTCEEPDNDADPATAIREIEDGATENATRKEPTENFLNYKPKKPKWWSRLCGNPTKAQKRATNELFQTHRLPKLEYGDLLNWSSIFPHGKDIWLEIGFGRGENLLALACRRKDENIAFVGSEINKSAMGTVCQRIQKSLESGIVWSDYVLYEHSPLMNPTSSVVGEAGRSRGASTADEQGAKIREDKRVAASGGDQSVQPYQNLRLYPGDAVKLFPYIPSSSLATVLVTFPDPFPQDQDKEWRVIQVATLQQIHRILCKFPSQGCFFLATDHEGYNTWCQEVMNEVNRGAVLFQKVEPCPDRLAWLPAVSRYEQKGWEEGRRTTLSCWVVE